MPIPDYQSIMLPLLKLLSDGQEHSLREAIEKLGSEFSLTEDERKELLPSGRQATFDNRVGWARTYLKKAGLIESTRRGYTRITARGKQVIKDSPERINVKYLGQFEEFNQFRSLRHEKTESAKEWDEDSEDTPEELLESAYSKVRQDLVAELLQTIKSCSPTFFEHLVIDVLVKMGYGGTRKDAGKAMGRSGDGGIDGIIKEDRLGLDTIYIQAKRWDNSVGRPEVQKFAGALQGHRAKKGIFITTSTYTKEAEEFVTNIDNKIVLIDGDMLGQLMIDHDVGVSRMALYEIKKVDTDYFTEA
ncbi:MAG: restriction endonuclease [Planctomycetes bacterium]|nr:restriction endonuclease [Planctomycetota bacterium]